ncbi:MAG: hypothetical protein PHV68_05060 [Candidatus Gastranaerophilales bacterium]|nr:hypothetical protein [Candidatus Gastranaerophilales bacterium]
MSIGAKDKIDKLLVKKYANEKMENHDNIVKCVVSAEEMLGVMNDYAQVQRNMLALNYKLKNIGTNLSTKVAYCKARA